MNALFWLGWYGWTVAVAIIVLYERGDLEWRPLVIAAMLWPILLPYALLDAPVRSISNTLRWWPRQTALIEMAERTLSRYPDGRRAQLTSWARRRDRLGRFLLRRYYAWLHEQLALEAKACRSEAA